MRGSLELQPFFRRIKGLFAAFRENEKTGKAFFDKLTGKALCFSCFFDMICVEERPFHDIKQPAPARLLS